MKKWNEMMEGLQAEVTCTKRDIAVKALIGALIGVIIGMMISPRKNQWFGCYNGNSVPEEQTDEEDEGEE